MEMFASSDGVDAASDPVLYTNDIIAIFVPSHDTKCQEPFQQVASLFGQHVDLLSVFGHVVDFKEETSSPGSFSCSIVFVPGEKPDYTCLLPAPAWGDDLLLDERWITKSVGFRHPLDPFFITPNHLACLLTYHPLAMVRRS
jgi:hypothetical protein